jgi:hypothetical protein
MYKKLGKEYGNRSVKVYFITNEVGLLQVNT